jgi:hypothetical protein
MLVPYSLSFYLLLYYLDLNVRDIENLRSQERELQEQIASSEEIFKRFQDEERSFMNQAANLRKQSVGYRKFIFYFHYTYHTHNCPRVFFYPKGSCIVGSFNFNLICVWRNMLTFEILSFYLISFRRPFVGKHK